MWSFFLSCVVHIWWLALDLSGKEKKSDFFYYLILWGFARFNVHFYALCFWFFYLVFALPGSFCTSFWLTCCSVSPKFDESWIIDVTCTYIHLPLFCGRPFPWIHHRILIFFLQTKLCLSNKVMLLMFWIILNFLAITSVHYSAVVLPYCMDHEQSAVWKNDSTQLSCSSQLPPT